MKRWLIAASIMIALFPTALLGISAKPAGPAPESGVNRGVVQIETERVHSWLTAVFALLALAGCVQVATEQGRPPYDNNMEDPRDRVVMAAVDRPVDTVAVGAVLLAANLQQGSERYRNLVNFTEAFFAGFQSLLEPGHHPKWREVNINAEFSGWRRFPPAEQWLQRNTQVSAAPNSEDLRAIFARFLDERQKAIGSTPLSQQEKDKLFGQFEVWQKNQSR